MVPRLSECLATGKAEPFLISACNINFISNALF
nr:MAG TPA: hypothetical protein [Caudoviricetes sp.]